MDASEIIPGLWQGGQHLSVLNLDFDAVIDLRLLQDRSIPLTNMGKLALWLPLVDSDIRPDLTSVYIVADFINTCMIHDYKTLVHCTQGLNRSGLIIGTFLIVHRKMFVDDAITLIRYKRPGALNNPTFVQFLKDLPK